MHSFFQQTGTPMFQFKTSFPVEHNADFHVIFLFFQSVCCKRKHWQGQPRHLVTANMFSETLRPQTTGVQCELVFTAWGVLNFDG